MRALFLTVAVAACLAAAAHGAKTATFRASIHKPQLQGAKGNRTIALEAVGTHPTLITGSNPDGLTIPERPRINPELILQESDGHITGAWLYFGNASFAVPDFTFALKKDANSDPIFSVQGTVERDVQYFPFAWDGKHASVNGLPTLLMAEVTLQHQDVTSFVYTLEDGLPADVFDTNQMYDLTPYNTTMLTKFMIKVDKTSGAKLSLWVSRKPISPSFTLIMVVDSKVFAQFNVKGDDESADALGFDVDVSENTGSVLKSRIDFIVHFYERPRAKTAVVTIPNMRAAINDLKAKDAPRSFKDFESSTPRLAIRLQYIRASNFVGLKVKQVEPMQSLQVSLYRVADGERRLFLREDDEVVPFYAADSDVLYGWDDALPPHDTNVTVDDVDLFDTAVEVELRYDAAPKDAQGVGAQLNRWLQTYGGDASTLDMGYLAQKEHSWKARHPLRLKHAVEANQEIARVPYQCLVTSSHIERSEWSKLIRSKAEAHDDHVKSNNIHADAPRIMLLAAAVAMQLFDESNNFRVYFNTFATSAHRLVVDYTDEELAAFAFEPAVKREAQRMKALWEKEFETLTAAADLLPRPVSKDQYYRARSQVETRLLNLTEQLVLVPVVDLMTHDAAPSAKVEYNDELHMVRIIASSDMAAGDAVTIDFGANEKTALDFLIQFGMVPAQTVKAVPMTVGEQTVYLTDTADSWTNVASVINKETAEDDRDDEAGVKAGEAELREQVKKRFSELPAQVSAGAAVPENVKSMAASLLEGARSVLHQQIRAHPEQGSD